MFFVLLICFVHLLILFYSKSRVFNIGKLFLLYWCLNIFLGIIIFYGKYDFEYYSFLYIFLCCDLFYIAFNAGNKKYIRLNKKVIHSNFDSLKQNRTILFICFFAGLLYFYLELKNNGFSIEYALNNLSSTANFFTDARYKGTELVTTTFQQICLTLNYSGCILSGFLIQKKKTSRKMLLILLIPMTLCMFTTTSKTGLISDILLMLSGYFVGLIKEKERIYFNVKKSLGVLVGLCVIIVGFYASFYIRYGSTEYTDIGNRILVYSFGHVPGYDNWFSHQEITLFGETFGYKFFYWIFNLIGLKEPSTIIRDFSTTTSLGWTNVPTSFSDYVTDFGILGNLLFVLILGGVLGVLFKTCQKSENAFLFGVVGLSYYCIFYSFLVSPLRYLSIVGAFFLFSLFVYYLQLKSRTVSCDGRRLSVRLL